MDGTESQERAVGWSTFLAGSKGSGRQTPPRWLTHALPASRVHIPSETRLIHYSINHCTSKLSQSLSGNKASRVGMPHCRQRSTPRLLSSSSVARKLTTISPHLQTRFQQIQIKRASLTSQKGGGEREYVIGLKQVDLRRFGIEYSQQADINCHYNNRHGW